MKIVRSLILLFTCTAISQTSIYTEIVSTFETPKEYLLARGKAKEIIAKTVSNPNDDKSVNEWIYEFDSEHEVRAKLYKNGDLLSTKTFQIDSLGQLIFSNVNFKHKALGWERKKIRYVYKPNLKEMRFLDAQNEVKYTMVVEYDSLGLPTAITSIKGSKKFDGLSKAFYDYEGGKYRYLVFNNKNAIVLNEVKNLNLDYILEKNDNGDVVKMYWPTAKKGSETIHNLDYKYDKRGNWIRIKKTLITPNKKKVLSIISRKIKYQD